MKTYCVRLEPLGPLYRGPHTHARKSGALVHSDTLHGALLCMAALEGAPILQRPEALRVSSLYPFWQDVLFFPRPFLPPVRVDASEPARDRKQWKSVRLVSRALLDAWLAGAPAADSVTLPGGLAVLASERKAFPAMPDLLVTAQASPAVTIDRATQAAAPYDRRGVRVNTQRGAGAYFLMQMEEADFPTVQRLVERLGEHGLGGERSVGYGHFAPLGFEEWPGLTAAHDGANAFMTLSLYCPTQEEVAQGVLEAPAAYDCTLRGGFIHGLAGSRLRKRTLRMCIEGSVFRSAGPRPGHVVDLAPAGHPHPVYRSGLALPLPFVYPKGTPA